MQKIASLLVAAFVILTGCSQPSSPWRTARAVRVDTRDSDDPSAAYAEHLSGVLKTAHVEHKIVTYEYRYRTALREEAIGTRTAVIYRDDKNPNNPWWLMDESLSKPVWLPGEDENRQVSFYMQKPATVVSTTTIGGEDGKRVIAAPDASESPERMVARLEPVRKTERSFQWPTWFGQWRHVQLASAASQRSSEMRRVRPSATREVESAAPSLVTLFRVRHGTNFDRASEVDRRKMEDLLLVTGSRSAGM
jgi:hypothetical protein